MSTRRPGRTSLRTHRPVKESEDCRNLLRSKPVRRRKAKRDGRKSQVSRVLNANGRTPSTCPHCQSTFRARIGLVKNLQKQFVNNPATSTSPPTNIPAANTSTTNTLITDDQVPDAPPITIPGTIYPASTHVSIAETGAANATTSHSTLPMG
nr:unnamed protein product [Spirometra erinaceieuropaei]